MSGHGQGRVILETPCGWVTGVQEGEVKAFYGLRYAEPPVGPDRRFRPPQPLEIWAGNYPADRYGPTAPQPAPLPYNPQQSEDCLTLNLWTSGTERPSRPVLLYVHGGGFVTGSGSNPLFHGRAFAEHDDIVVVTINYRLGALGFLDLHEQLGDEYRSSGNCGMLDVIEALRWVQRNIGCFGGDPSRVTVMGQSAGAKLLGGVLCSPLAEGLFHQAILHSGSVQAVRDRQTAAALTGRFLTQLGVKPDHAGRLLDMPVSELMAAQMAWCRDLRSVHHFGPVIDGNAIPDEPLTQLDKRSRPLPSLLLGTNRNETAGFIAGDPLLAEPSAALLHSLFGDHADFVQAVYERRSGRPLDASADAAVWEADLTDCMYRFAAIRTADAYAAAGADVWLYRFDLAGPYGAAHGNELIYVWRPPSANTDPALAARMHRAWAGFIRTGSPQPAIPEWRRYGTDDARSFIRLDAVCTSGQVEAPPDAQEFPTAVYRLH